MTDKDGQKITVHEDILMNTQSVVGGPDQAGMGSMDNPLFADPKKVFLWGRIIIIIITTLI